VVHSAAAVGTAATAAGRTPSADMLAHRCMPCSCLVLCCHRILSHASERLAVLDPSLVLPDQHQRLTARWQLVSGCTTLAPSGGLPAAKARQLCQRSLQLLLGSGTASLQVLSSASTAIAQQRQLAEAAAPSDLALAEEMSCQAAALCSTLRWAEGCGWFGAPATADECCPPDKLTGWVAEALRVLQVLESARGTTGGQGHVGQVASAW